MPLLSLKNVRARDGEQVVLDAASFDLDHGQRLMLVGPGSAGIRAVLEIATGRRPCDAGSVDLAAGARSCSLRLGALDLDEERSLLDSVLEGEGRPERAKREQDGADDVHSTELERRATAVLEAVGFDSARHDQPTRLLSQAERHRLLLARALISDADLLLLEEPTRYLDIQATEMLEAFLKRHPGGCVIASTDRAFIGSVATALIGIELDGSLASYPPAFDSYQRIRGQRLQAGEASEPAALPFWEGEHSGKVVFGAKELMLRPGGQVLLEGVSFQIGQGERVGIVGATGCGKSSLLRVLADLEQPESGRVQRGFRALTGYFDQELSGLTTGRTVHEELAALRDDLDAEALCQAAARFLFSAEEIERRVEDLSSGEQRRLALLLLLLGRSNVVLLDEPTIQLDMEAQAVLEQALQDYPGTVVVVSRDRAFLDRVAKRILSIESRALVDARGAYSELRRSGQIMSEIPRKPRLDGLLPTERAEVGLDASELESLVRKQQALIEELLEKMADPAMALDWEGLERLSAEKAAIEKEMEANRAALERLSRASE
ncbi:MAG: ABC-F family ATP-binding cassette domain-containing protein [Deltaproteobacteria bacterium]|nr:ABC-F family ATP-binding cassette domain-containing protein [Deltaproteobacteria bacterium]